MKKTVIYYEILDLDHPMYHPKTFNTLNEAKIELDKEYTNSTNEYWRNRRTGIQKVTVEKELLYSNK